MSAGGEAGDGPAGLFRAEAVEHHAGGETEGDVLRFDARWARRTVPLLLAAALAAFLFVSLFSVDEYATGPAIVQVAGRRTILAAEAGTVADVVVRPGQSVEACEALVRLDGADVERELARASEELDRQIGRMLRDPSDAAVKQALATVRAQRDRAANAAAARAYHADASGCVSDVRVRPGQHVEPGDVLATLVPEGARDVTLVSVVAAEFLPMLRPGAKMRFELDGFRYEYEDLAVADVSAEAIGAREVARLLGGERGDAVALDAGAKVLVTATLPAATFRSEGRPYAYFDGLTGRAEVRVRSEPLLVTLVPALRRFLG